ncbi:transketolase, partial [Candidatus Desantisbacteria bacterium]|nr:transketolase [Candidatus Desantisbacteria bacterium]
NFDAHNIKWEKRDIFIISKGHGSISFYPILADFGYFNKHELSRVCKEGSFLGGIPDPLIPGYETMNGSLGHGLGVACGIALALKKKKRKERVFVLIGDGELYEGSVWEAVMFAGEHKLDNLILIIDNNKICMLDFCKKILDIEPLDEKFKVHKWTVSRVNGHDVEKLYNSLVILTKDKRKEPKVLIADTTKGKGVKSLEKDSLCHIRSLKEEEIDLIISELK